MWEGARRGNRRWKIIRGSIVQETKLNGLLGNFSGETVTSRWSNCTNTWSVTWNNGILWVFRRVNTWLVVMNQSRRSLLPLVIQCLYHHTHVPSLYSTSSKNGHRKSTRDLGVRNVRYKHKNLMNMECNGSRMDQTQHSPQTSHTPRWWSMSETSSQYTDQGDFLSGRTMSCRTCLCLSHVEFTLLDSDDLKTRE